ncbi:hypothetical protein M885DRAFT_507427 [Pelagophyceae sp. CCMP2097]|nr:hypothetical protein M885DRAFT_507427 [Pelagophyceae sp. CCMP2097]
MGRCWAVVACLAALSRSFELRGFGSLARLRARPRTALCSSLEPPVLRGAAASNVGRPHTTESRARISAANKGKTPWNKGKSHTEETRIKIAAATRSAMENKRRVEAEKLGCTNFTEWEEQRILAKRRGNKKPRNTTLSAETKAKISIALKARWQDPELRASMTALRLDRRSTNETRRPGVYQHSNETKELISQRVRERMRDRPAVPPSNETRARISATLKARWQDPVFRAKMLDKEGGSSAKEKKRSETHSKRIAEAIKTKWSDDEAYRERTLGGIRRAAASRQPGDDTPMPPQPTVPRKSAAEKKAQAAVAAAAARVAARRAEKALQRQRTAERAAKAEALGIEALDATETDRRDRLKYTAPDLWAALYDDEDDHLFAPR